MNNKLGWLIAAGMVVVILAVVLLIWALPGSPSAPTAATTAPDRLRRIDVPPSIWGVVNPPTGSGLAADDYNKAVVEYYNTRRYADLQKMSAEQQLAIPQTKFPYKVCRFILAGAAKKQMGYFTQYVPPTEAVTYGYREMAEMSEADKPPIPHLQAFTAMAKTALLYGRICEKNKDFREAERIYKAVLIFGWHVAEDRVRLWGFQVGLHIQRVAAERLAEFHAARGENDRGEKVGRFIEDLDRATRATNAKAGEALLRLTTSGHLYVGDLLNLAANDADPMWRVEAIHQLGLARAAMSKGGKKADRKAIESLLTELKSQSDPLLKAAAEHALGMTVTDVRSAG